MGGSTYTFSTADLQYQLAMTEAQQYYINTTRVTTASEFSANLMPRTPVAKLPEKLEIIQQHKRKITLEE